MKVLSLFDGMACGMLAMMRAGVDVERYVAYEIDKYAVKTSSHNFPTIEQCGDVFDADFTEYEGFDFLIGGSPCTYWSIAQTKNRETTASGLGWELFSQYVRALHEAKPKFFIYENNKSMSKDIRASITETFGFEPICINSALVSAQNRQRLYWVGIRNEDGTYRKANVEQPEDKGILLKDVLETGNALFDKAYTLASSYYKGAGSDIPRQLGGKSQYGDRAMVAEPICLNSQSGRGGVDGLQPSLQDRIYSTEGKSTAVTTAFMPKIAEPLRTMNYELESVTDKDSGIIAMLDMPGSHDILRRVYGENGKSPTINTCRGGNTEPKVFQQLPEQFFKSAKTPINEVKDGMITVKGKQYPIKLVDGFYIIRKLTVRECMRLQTVPEWYEFPVSNSQAYKMLGNGWTVEVIAHLIEGIRTSIARIAE